MGLLQGWFRQGPSTTSGAPSVLGTGQTASPEASPSSATSTEPSPSEQSTGKGVSSTQASSAAVQALQKCRAKVQARDQVLTAAATGVGHWSEHVDAQTDLNDGDISSKQMQAIFKRTRLDGPADVRRYRAALARQDELSGSCQPPRGAPAEITAKMASCAKRGQAQQPVLAAAENAMEDWRSHLADMRQSRMGHVHDAQAVWIKTWRAAPRNINAYRKATAEFDAPGC